MDLERVQPKKAWTSNAQVSFINSAIRGRELLDWCLFVGTFSKFRNLKYLFLKRYSRKVKGNRLGFPTPLWLCNHLSTSSIELTSLVDNKRAHEGTRLMYKYKYVFACIFYVHVYMYSNWCETWNISNWKIRSEINKSRIRFSIFHF